MAKKNDRGKKRKCQNEECASSFYDLGRAEFECPECSTPFDHKLEDSNAEQPVSDYRRRGRSRVLPIVASPEPEDSSDQLEGEDANEPSEDAESDDSIGEAAHALITDDEEDSLPVETSRLSDGDEEA